MTTWTDNELARDMVWDECGSFDFLYPYHDGDWGWASEASGYIVEEDGHYGVIEGSGVSVLQAFVSAGTEDLQTYEV